MTGRHKFPHRGSCKQLCKTQVGHGLTAWTADDRVVFGKRGSRTEFVGIDVLYVKNTRWRVGNASGFSGLRRICGRMHGNMFGLNAGLTRYIAGSSQSNTPR